MANIDLILQVLLKRIQELPDPKVSCRTFGLGIWVLIVTGLTAIGGLVWFL